MIEANDSISREKHDSEASHKDIYEFIGGVPFVSEGFEPDKLVYLVCKLRHQIDSYDSPVYSSSGVSSVGVKTDYSEYLNPEKACSVYKKAIPKENYSISKSRPTTQFEQLAIKKSIDAITIRNPAWKALFEIPIEFRVLQDQHISLTNPLVPQVVCLGDSTITSFDTLNELLVHEMSHVWCSFVCELTDFQNKESPSDLVLPSGTSGKNPRQVILAACFAAAALNFYFSDYKHTGVFKHKKRTSELCLYLEQSIQVLNLNASELNQMGIAFLIDLTSFANHCRSFIHEMENSYA